MQGFHLLPDLLPVISLIRASLIRQGVINTIPPIFTLPLLMIVHGQSTCSHNITHGRYWNRSVFSFRAAELRAAFDVARR